MLGGVCRGVMHPTPFYCLILLPNVNHLVNPSYLVDPGIPRISKIYLQLQCIQRITDFNESSSCKFNEDINSTKAERVGHSHGQIVHPTEIGVEKLPNIKYFIIKSLNHQNLRLSIEKGIWATQIMNEPILEEAFHNSGTVILIFSVNMSGSFQGYAQMMSPIGWRRDNVWSEGSGKSNPWGRSFKVKWLCLNDLPFHKTLHLKNPLNDYKPVKISRDCQELSPDIGLALCELLADKHDTDGLLSSSTRDDFSLKEHYANMNQAEANIFHSTNQRFSGTTFTEIFPISLESSEVSSGIKRSHVSEGIPKLQVSKDVASQFDFRALSSGSPLASTLTEDDFLDMSYEEYLEVHSRCSKQLRISASKPSQKQLESLRSNSLDDDSNLDSVDRDKSNSRGKMHQSLPWI